MLAKFLGLRDPHRRQEVIGTLRLAGLLLALRIKCWLNRQKLVVVVLLETLGDIVACQPVPAYLRSQHARLCLVWICKPLYADLIRHNPDVDVVATVPCLMSWLRLSKYGFANQQIDLNIAGRACHDCGRATADNNNKSTITLKNFFNYGGLLPAFCLAAGLPPLSESPELYFPDDMPQRLVRFKLPKEYIVFHCMSLSPVKDWEASKWKELGEQISERLGIAIVEIGLTSVLEKSGYLHFLNLCNQTGFLEAAAIIERAALFVGIDSGPAHLANAVRCPAVILLGQYFHFTDYLPYTGYFTDGGATIVRSRGSVSSLAVTKVFEAVEHRLRNELRTAQQAVFLPGSQA